MNELEPKPPVCLPDAPKHLGKVAKKEWKVVAAQLHALGLLTVVDTNALAMYCECWEQYLDAVEDVRTNGQIIDSPKGFRMKNPAVTIMNEQRQAIIKLSSEFGLTPSARAKLSVAPADETEDEWTGILSAVG